MIWLREGINRLKTYQCFFGAIGLAASLLMSALALSNSLKPVVFKTLAANEIKDSYVAQLARQNFTKEQQAQKVEKFTKAFKEEISRTSC